MSINLSQKDLKKISNKSTEIKTNEDIIQVPIKVIHTDLKKETKVICQWLSLIKRLDSI